MTDFSNYLAVGIAEWMSQQTQMPTPPSDLYVELVDDTGSELSSSVENGRVAVSTSGGWTLNGSDFENSGEVDFGEATADITIDEAALYDASSGGNLLAQFSLEDGSGNDTSTDVTSGTRVFYAAGEISFDVIERGE